MPMARLFNFWAGPVNRNWIRIKWGPRLINRTDCGPVPLVCFIISKPLATLINISVERESFPSKLKHAVIIPIFKDSDETDPNNYRPISLLSVFNGIFEKIMYHRLKQFLNKHNIFYNYQYGFRERCSTEHAILDIVNRIQRNMDKGMFSCGFFIDLQKHSIQLIMISYFISCLITEFVV